MSTPLKLHLCKGRAVKDDLCYRSLGLIYAVGSRYMLKATFRRQIKDWLVGGRRFGRTADRN